MDHLGRQGSFGRDASPLITYGSQWHPESADPDTMQLVQNLDDHTHAVCCVRWSHRSARPPLRTLVSGDRSGCILVDDVADGQVLLAVQGQGQVIDMRWHNADATLLLAGHGLHTFVLWDIVTSNRLWCKEFGDQVCSIALDPFSCITMVQGWLCLVDDLSGQEAKENRNHPKDDLMDKHQVQWHRSCEYGKRMQHKWQAVERNANEQVVVLQALRAKRELPPMIAAVLCAAARERARQKVETAARVERKRKKRRAFKLRQKRLYRQRRETREVKQKRLWRQEAIERMTRALRQDAMSMVPHAPRPVRRWVPSQVRGARRSKEVHGKRVFSAGQLSRQQLRRKVYRPRGLRSRRAEATRACINTAVLLLLPLVLAVGTAPAVSGVALATSTISLQQVQRRYVLKG